MEWGVLVTSMVMVAWQDPSPNHLSGLFRPCFWKWPLFWFLSAQQSRTSCHVARKPSVGARYEERAACLQGRNGQPGTPALPSFLPAGWDTESPWPSSTTRPTRPPRHQHLCLLFVVYCALGGSVKHKDSHSPTQCFCPTFKPSSYIKAGPSEWPGRVGVGETMSCEQPQVRADQNRSHRGPATFYNVSWVPLQLQGAD